MASRTGVLRRHAAIASILIASACLSFHHLGWGLPNGNVTWAHDALVPLAPLSVVQASFLSGWNSGWFFYKYPIGHFLLLAVLYSPYLGWLWWSGDLHSLSAVYPHGFADPESALTALSLIGRAVSAAMAVLTVACTYLIGSALFDKRAAVLAALALATSPVLVYYAHTTNLDAPCLFWIAAAWLAAMRTFGERRRRWTIAFGVVSGVALATKEQAAGALLGLSLLVALAHVQSWRRDGIGWRQAALDLSAGAGAGIVVLLVLSNAFWNPLGYVHRILFLAGRLPPDVHALYVPRASFFAAGDVPGLTRHAHLLRDVVLAIGGSIGPAWLLLAAGGAIVAMRRSPASLLIVLVPAVAYYAVSIVALPVVAVRFVLPLTLAACLLGGVMAASLWTAGGAARAVVVVAALLSMWNGIGVNYLLRTDGRYQAERWMAANTAAGQTVETYHKEAFLPRFPPHIEVLRPAFEEISIPRFHDRQPDFVLVSVADMHRIFRHYDRTEAHTVSRTENEEFLRQLLDGTLGYREVERFRSRWPGMAEAMIRSLNPELILYAGPAAASGTAAAPRRTPGDTL